MKTRKNKATAKRHRKMNPDPPALQSTQPNLPVQGPILTPRLKFLLAIAGLSILIMAITIGIRYLPNLLNPPKPTPAPALTPSPSPTINRVEVLPERKRKEPQSMEYEVFGKAKVITGATLEKTIKEGQEYQVRLDSGKTITAVITPKTLLGDAWFEVDQNGTIVKTSYQIITADKLTDLKVGSKLTLSFFKNDLVNNQVKVGEFVLLD